MAEVAFLLFCFYLIYIFSVAMFRVTVHFLRGFSHFLWEWRGLLLLVAAILVLMLLGGGAP